MQRRNDSRDEGLNEENQTESSDRMYSLDEAAAELNLSIEDVMAYLPEIAPDFDTRPNGLMTRREFAALARVMQDARP